LHHDITNRATNESNEISTRGWSFLGGLLIVSTVTYINIQSITIVAKDMQSTLSRESKKLQSASKPTASTTTDKFPTDEETLKMGDTVKWFTTTRVVDRIKKMWNEDIEKGIRQVQNTDWERMSRGFGEHMKRAQERMATSFARNIGEDTKKKKST
jgi:hypothetical protein